MGWGDISRVTYDGRIEKGGRGPNTHPFGNEHGNALRACRQRCQQSTAAVLVISITTLFYSYIATTSKYISKLRQSINQNIYSLHPQFH